MRGYKAYNYHSYFLGIKWTFSPLCSHELNGWFWPMILVSWGAIPHVQHSCPHNLDTHFPHDVTIVIVITTPHYCTCNSKFMSKCQPSTDILVVFFTPWKVHHPSPVSCQVENPWLTRNQYTLPGEFTAAQCRLPLSFATKFKTICILWCVLAPRTLTNPPTKRVWRPLRNKGEVFLHFIFKLPQIRVIF
jgi:hypothetical protein